MHSIRLRGPWECYLGDAAAPLRIEMPATWEELRSTLLAGAPPPLPCPLRLIRRFGMPTGIVPSDRLELVIDSLGTPANVALNSIHLAGLVPTTESSRLDITPLLAPRNELTLTCDDFPASAPSTPPLPCPIGEVRLEITSGPLAE